MSERFRMQPRAMIATTRGSNALLIVLTLVVLQILGCAPVAPYRTAVGECVVAGEAERDRRATCGKYSTEKHDSFVVSYVELTDMGLFYDRRQLESTIRQVTPSDGEPVDVILYVHGWKHSADYKDPDIADFSRNVMRYMTAGVTGRRTVGIYVGWRGTPITLPLLKGLTFYDRKGAADHIARGSIRELLSRLRSIRQEAAPGTFTVTAVGHSFGGLILFNAISGSIMDAVTQVEYQGFAAARPRSTLFDLAILLNPAFEGIRFEPIFQAALYGIDRRLLRTMWPTDSPPILISITSAADAATREVFPLGRAVNSLLQHEGRTDQDSDDTLRNDWVEKLGNRNTVGHMKRYRTHSLVLDKSGQVDCAPSKENALLANPSGFPLWSIYTDAPFIKDHNDIFSKRLWAYVSMLRNEVRMGSVCPSGFIGSE